MFEQQSMPSARRHVDTMGGSFIFVWYYNSRDERCNVEDVASQRSRQGVVLGRSGSASVSTTQDEYAFRKVS